MTQVACHRAELSCSHHICLGIGRTGVACASWTHPLQAALIEVACCRAELADTVGLQPSPQLAESTLLLSQLKYATCTDRCCFAVGLSWQTLLGSNHLRQALAGLATKLLIWRMHDGWNMFTMYRQSNMLVRALQNIASLSLLSAVSNIRSNDRLSSIIT